MNEQRGGGPEKPLAVVVGHGEFAGGLVSAVGEICGMADKLGVLSMMGMTPEDIEGTIREQLSRTGARVIFSDLAGVVATVGGRRIVNDERGNVVVGGVKLAARLG